jgi:hypothetical protein|tara:strand:- start:1562 stop:2368 length:807 start_codon:yes stop_codon:yes gene_type:complete
LNRVFVLGNGESRKDIDIAGLKHLGPVYGCNGLYRDFSPNALIVVDGGMQHEVYSSGYCYENKCWFRSWTKLPEYAYEALSEKTDIKNEKGNSKEFVLNGTDPKQMEVLREHHIKLGTDQKTIDELLSKHQRWLTWTQDDMVNIIPKDYSGWSAGPIAVRIAIEEEQPDEVYLIGFDLGSPNELINNVYKDTDNYLSKDVAVTPSVNWINQHSKNFEKYPNIKFWKVNPAPLGTNGSSQFVEEWRNFDNVEYIEQENLHLVLDYAVFL